MKRIRPKATAENMLVGAITPIGKERAQPDMQELAGHMEENEKAQQDDKKEDKAKKQLGRLHYSLDYDFQKGEVP